MLPPTRILVAVDFCEASAGALAYAARLSRLFDAELDVLHVIHPLLASTAAENSLDLTADTHEFLESFSATVPCLPAGARYHVITGLPSDTIMHIADREGADLIVTGSRGVTLPERVVSGSTTERLLRLSDISIVVVPESNAPAGTAVGIPIGRIVVGLECTAGAADATRAAHRMATALGADLRFVHAVPEFVTAPFGSAVASLALRRRCDAARDELKRILAGLPGESLRLDVRVGTAPHVLTEAIAGEPDSLVVVGRCFGAPGHPGGASVARRVLMLGAAPVLMHVSQA